MIGDDPQHIKGFDRLGKMKGFLVAIRKARKFGMKYPPYLAPLTKEEKQLVEDAYVIFNSPELLEKYMSEVEETELQHTRLLILRDRIESPWLD